MSTSKSTQLTIQITIHGYGGECYMGMVDRKTYDYFKKNEIDLEQLANDFDDDKWSFIPEEHQIFPPGSPYECSDLGHETGATMDDSSFIVVEGEDGKVIWESNLDPYTLKLKGIDVDIHDEVNLNDAKDGTVIFWGGQGEKGTFFESVISIDAPFDPKKLRISCSNMDGWLLSSSVEYNGIEIDGSDGYDTSGKWAENKFCIVGDEEVYEGRERDDEGQLYSDDDTPDGYQNSPIDWEKSSRIKKGNPIRIGWYECNFSYGTTYGSLYWNGSEWQSFRNGRPIKECDTVNWWYGFNWDTTNWDNRPTEPPEARCKKCNWLGKQDDMLRNRKGDLTCPSCKAKKDDIDWLDYDPETKKGVENRKKYCV